LAAAEKEIQAIATKIAAAKPSYPSKRDTQTRLLKEQRDKQRELDKLEAQTQALQESRAPTPPSCCSTAAWRASAGW
jgi:chromosome segregation protein